MATVKKNLMDLALRQSLIGAQIVTSEGTKTISEFIDYDSMTHSFTIEFTNGDIQEISDKLKFEIVIDANNKAKKNPNKKRVEE